MAEFKTKLVVVILIAAVFFFGTAPLSQVIQETETIDYTHPDVLDIANSIQAQTDDKFEQIRMAADMIFADTRYQILGEECLLESASDVITERKGDCSSMSKLNLAVLSSLGISSKMIAGCVTDLEPTLDITLEDRLGRESQSINFTIQKPKRPPADFPANKLAAPGFAHAWVRAHDGRDWITVETTAGVVFPTDFEKVIGYIEFEEVDYNDPFSMCYLPAEFFKEKCI